MGLRNTAVAGALIILAAIGVAAPQLANADPTPSAGDIIAKCVKAYDVLQSYRCHVDVTSTVSGATYRTTADIVFARPEKIRAEGLTMGGQPFAYVSNGPATQEISSGSWQTQSSAEMAIGGATGIAMGAATTIPALLLHTAWGYPFLAREIDPHVVAVTVAGHPCYRVAQGGPEAMVFWIDQKTLLLDQMSSDLPQSTPGIHELQVITNQQINPAITSSTFVVPPTASPV